MTQYDVVKVYGRVGIFIENRIEHIPDAILPPNHFAYDIQHADDDDRHASILMKSTDINRMGTVIVKRPINALEIDESEGIYLDSNTDWQLRFISHGDMDLETFATLTEFQAATYVLEFPIEDILDRLDEYINTHPNAAIAGSEYAMTNAQANQDAIELVMDILDTISNTWDAANFMPGAPEDEDVSGETEIEHSTEVNIQTDVFDVAELLGNRVLLLTKPFATSLNHVGYAIVNELMVYDMYYVPTDPEQMERVRIIQAQAEKSEGYYGTILTKYEIPGAGTDTADDGSIHINVADIIKCGDQMQAIRTTVQSFVDFYKGTFFVPQTPLILQLLNQHGAMNPNHVYYGAEGIRDTKEDMDKAITAMCHIFDEYRRVNLDIDPTSRPALHNAEQS